MEEHIYTRLKVSEKHGVKLCLFDKEGVELYDRHFWSVCQKGKSFYLQRNIIVNGKRTVLLFHRELLGLRNGEIRDHWNGIGTDNRICNLRPSTQQENTFNQSISKNNKSGIKGVSWHIASNKWVSQIQFDGEKIHLGCFDDIKEAEKVVRAKREELHKDFANHGK